MLGRRPVQRCCQRCLDRQVRHGPRRLAVPDRRALRIRERERERERLRAFRLRIGEHRHLDRLLRFARLAGVFPAELPSPLSKRAKRIALHWRCWIWRTHCRDCVMTHDSSFSTASGCSIPEGLRFFPHQKFSSRRYAPSALMFALPRRPRPVGFAPIASENTAWHSPRDNLEGER